MRLLHNNSFSAEFVEEIWSMHDMDKILILMRRGRGGHSVKDGDTFISIVTFSEEDEVVGMDILDEVGVNLQVGGATYLVT